MGNSAWVNTIQRWCIHSHSSKSQGQIDPRPDLVWLSHDPLITTELGKHADGRRAGNVIHPGTRTGTQCCGWLRVVR